MKKLSYFTLVSLIFLIIGGCSSSTKTLSSNSKETNTKQKSVVKTDAQMESSFELNYEKIPKNQSHSSESEINGSDVSGQKKVEVNDLKNHVKNLSSKGYISKKDSSKIQKEIDKHGEKAIEALNKKEELNGELLALSTNELLEFSEVMQEEDDEKNETEENSGNGKDQLVALLLAFFIGAIGIHRFYLGYTGIGIAQLLTLGGCGIWALIDLIRIATGDLKPKGGVYSNKL